MKKLLSILLAGCLITLCCTGCSKKSDDTETEATEAPSDSGLEQALANTGDDTGSYVITDDELTDEDEDMPAAEDEAVDSGSATEEADSAEDTSAEDSAGDNADGSSADTSVVVSQNEVVPFATDAPQPNASITSFSDCSNTGLGFKFNYPTGWNNLPGRSTICYIQPITNGTVYPARVAITMKRLSHACGVESMKEELTSYRDLLKKQFTSFEVVDNAVDTETEFMGKSAMSFVYLAYDGEQEIKGYVIMTHFDRYVFCFHFLCAFGDYDSFYSSMTKMRDSVQVEQED